ncbi:MAG: hypothetical protein JRI57_01950 [Deltaproteobacteria bacterium]|nr:hypothetical protein [Deltaproteobacteria bacterium]MBW1952933.1 hypothetical protein [Deltaproteobacteria bacterium]MBW1986441.1 hypothetical protein [Deltaproteobacteria bacterium]MBW2133835.1 hypothetical protein [Deltaproteobacteria bacterium]
MKRGVIIYIADSDNLAENFDFQKALANIDYQGDQMGIVSAKEGYFDVHEAFFSMMVKGCGRVSLVVAQAEGSDRLHPLKPPVRLIG